MGEFHERAVERVSRIVQVLESLGVAEEECSSIYAPRNHFGFDVSVLEPAFLRIFAGREVTRVGGGECIWPRWEGVIDGIKFEANSSSKVPKGRIPLRLPALGMAECADLNPHSDVPFAEQAPPAVEVAGE